MARLGRSIRSGLSLASSKGKTQEFFDVEEDDLGNGGVGLNGVKPVKVAFLVSSSFASRPRSEPGRFELIYYSS